MNTAILTNTAHRLKRASQFIAHHIWRLIKRYPASSGSLALHMAIAILIVAQMPSYDDQERLFDAITVDLVSAPEAAKMAKPRTLKPRVAAKPKAKPAAPLKPRVKAKPLAKPKPAPKPQAKPEPKPEAPVSKTVEENEPLPALVDIDPAKQEAENASEGENAAPISYTERESIIGQIAKHWSIPAGARNAEDLIVKLQLSIARDGTVYHVEVVDQSRYRSDSIFRAAADSASSAAYNASPLQYLPPAKYNRWKTILLTFNPKDMLN